MTQEEYESVISPSIVNDVFMGETLERSRGKYIISVAGKIVTIKGRVFYDSKSQATKAFYNSFSWKARRAIWANVRGSGNNRDPYGYWSSPDRSLMWTTFKKVLARDYGFKIQQV